MLFSWQIKEGAHEFTEAEDRLIKWWLRTLVKECPRTCSFLTLFDLDALKFYWAPNLTLSNGVLGAWDMMSPDKVYMCVQPNEMMTVGGMREDGSSRSGYIKDIKLASKGLHIFDTGFTITVIHELIHKLQFTTSPALYIVNRLLTLFVDRIPFIERIGIEHDARVNSETEELKTFASDFGSAYSAYYSAVNAKTPDDPDNYLYKCFKGIDGYDRSYDPRYIELAEEAMNIINK